MSLRDEIEQRRMAQSANGNAVSAKPEKPEKQQSGTATFLRLVKLTKQCWVLPWSSFHGVGYTPSSTATGDDASKHEHLHMVFVRHEVTVRGHNLAGVVNAIETTSLRELCETAEKYTDVRKPDAATPVILAMEINVKTQ